MDPFDRLRTALADRYAVEREIGRGGMAIVYLAHDFRHNRNVAIKLLQPEFAIAVSAERFLREIQIEARLRHPYILPLFDSGEADGLPYYVMPYVAGQSLQARLKRETQLPIGDALRITSEIAEALAYAHTRGVVHRDVKPGNILLDDNHALLADFGIARAVSEVGASALSDSGLVVGTPEYMSPEQCSHAGNLDGRSDIYALGCVLYQMLSGEPPFRGATAQAVIARHLQEQPRSLRVVRSTIPDHVEEAVQVALAKVPADRFTTAVEFVAALDPQGDTAPAIRRARANRRRRARRTGAIFAGAAVVVSLSLWTARSPAPELTGLGDTSRSPSLSSIAVLYLQDRSEGGKLGHLAAGLTEDLIDLLAAVKALRVISPDGVRPYRYSDVPLDSLVQLLKVGTVVTGTLSGDAQRLRASVRLTDAATGVQLFSGSFEKPLRDVLVLREQIAEEVARQLRIRLGEEVQLHELRANTTSARAWELVLRAEQLRQQAQELPARDSAANAALVHGADSILTMAETLDPQWAEPAILQGWLAYDQADRAASAVRDASWDSDSRVMLWINRGIRHADRALRKVPGLGEALELRGSLLYRGWALTSLGGAHDTTRQLERAERDLRASAGVPHRHRARALSTLSTVLLFAGKPAEANLAARHAYEADAYLRDASAIVFRLFATSLDLKRFGEAADWCERGRRTFPGQWLFLSCQLSLMAWSPRTLPDGKKAWAIMAEVDSAATPDELTWLRPQMTMIVAAVLARAGFPDSAERVIATAKAASPTDPEIPYYEALARLRMGQLRKAALLVRQVLQQDPNLKPFLRSQSLLAPVWTDPVLLDL